MHSADIPKDTIIVDAVLDSSDDQKVAIHIPKSVIRNSATLNKELLIRPVDKLCYEYNEKVFLKICAKYGFEALDNSLIKELIDLNSGHITSHMLREYLHVAWAVCSRLADDLAINKQACLDVEGRHLYKISRLNFGS
jgi:hypothetical protein